MATMRECGDSGCCPSKPMVLGGSSTERAHCSPRPPWL
jgi:hypothetical protein